MNLNENQRNPGNSEEYDIVLPCNQKDFGAFISGLLGKPQVIERVFKGIYELNQCDIENTYHLVEQRVHQQNEAVLIQFVVNVYYDDNSAVQLNSLEDFMLYREVRPLVPIAVNLTWIYMIKFRDKTTPEKQVIELSFGYPFRTVYDKAMSQVHLNISHTARTWGTDIEALLSGHVKTLFKYVNKWQRLITKYSVKIGLSFGILFFVIALIGGYIISRQIATYQLSVVNQFLSGKFQADTIVTDKLDFLLREYAKGTWARFYFAFVWYIIVTLIGSILFGVWVGSTADNEPSSFLLFTQKGKEIYKEYLRRRRHAWGLFILSIVTSVTTGVLANFVFAIISQRWLMK